MKIYDLINKTIFCTLHVSRSIKNITSHGFFRFNEKIWYTTIRKDSSSGNMHFFQLQKKDEKNPIESKYKRYVNLYEKTFKDYQLANRVIGPDFYLNNGAVFCFSLCGAVHDMIDFTRQGNHESKVT